MRFSTLFTFALLTSSAAIAAPAPTGGDDASVSVPDPSLLDDRPLWWDGWPGPGKPGHEEVERVSQTWRKDFDSLKQRVSSLSNEARETIYERTRVFLEEFASYSLVNWNEDTTGTLLFDELEKMLPYLNHVTRIQLVNLKAFEEDIMRVLESQMHPEQDGQ